MVRGSLLLAVSICCAACGAASAPVSPTAPVGPMTGSLSTAVRVVDAITGAPLAGITAAFGALTAQPSDAAGLCTVCSGGSGQYRVTFSGSSVVQRTSMVRVPGADTTVSLVPVSFGGTDADSAFDEMFRPSQKLQRWTSAPPLVILTRQVQFETTSSNELTVLPDEMTADDRAALVKDLSDGLLALTDRQLGDFASVTFESPAPGTRVSVMRNGAIVVARCKGLSAGTTPSYWGYGRWATNASYAVVGGNVMIDADFDGPSSNYAQYRRCLRIHELGHALGYNHVTRCPSVMNSAARLEPNAWDLQAVHIAFQRPTGNTAPDSDPTAYSLNARTGAVTWGPPIF